MFKYDIIKDTFKRSEWYQMVQIEAPNTPECQEGVPSQGGQHREEHSVDHHVQVEHYQGHKPNHEPNHKQNHEQNHEQNHDS